MSYGEDRPPTRTLGSIGPEDASRLLLIGYEHRDRPVDQVIARLAEPDGESWLSRAVAAITGLDGAPHGGGGELPLLSDLRVAKNRAKAAMARARSREDVASATAAYLVAVGMAAALRGTCISRRPPEELAEMLAELAAVAPAGWADMLRDASARIAPFLSPSGWRSFRPAS
jgi:hypothetical protein